MIMVMMTGRVTFLGIMSLDQETPSGDATTLASNKAA